jgi:mono/diheme cytochrome c family protein
VQVTAFTSQTHPQFHSAASDPGRLKFSHRRHLAHGLNLGPNDRFPAQKLKDLDPADREHYRVAGQKDEDLIQLDCAACHRTELPVASSSAASPGSWKQPQTGAYMLPIKFEEHCQACHRLNLQPAAQAANSPRALPHGLKPKEMEQFLRAVYTSDYLDSDAPLPARTPADQRLPGKPAAETPAAKAAILDQVTRADTYFRGRCQECHALSGMPTQEAIEPTRVPDVWLEHARFDHSAHRAVACRVCHTQDYLYQPWQTGPNSTGLDNQDVLLPKLEVCVGCHAPRSASGTGGARFDCLECHIYHAADHPGGTRGVTSRAVEQRWQLNEFLQGVGPHKTP